MITVKQNMKLIGVIILCFCAIFICTAFMNYAIDLNSIDSSNLDETARIIFDGQKAMSSVIVACAGGIMGAIALIVLLYTIGRLINENQPSMGVLKALGHSEHKIALSFLKFGLSVFIGCALGFAGGYAFSPFMYDIFNNGELPDVILKFHLSALIFLAVLPSLAFTTIAYFYALIKLKKPPLEMIHETKKVKTGRLSVKLQSKVKQKPFLKDLKKSVLFNNLTLVFFVGIAGFGFSAQIQIAFLMQEVNMDITFSAINLIIGAAIGLITLILALSYVLNSNKKYIAMMKAYGYSDAQCGGALFGGYRIISYIGFAIGTVYQYFFMKFMISLFAGAYDVELDFNIIGFFITLCAYLICYEFILLFYKKQISRIPLKEIMQA